MNKPNSFVDRYLILIFFIVINHDLKKQERHPFHDREQITNFLNYQEQIIQIRREKENNLVMKSSNTIGWRNSN